MSRLDLRFLGTPEVWHQGQLLKFPTRKALALLVYMAVAGGWHSREKLTALLWPENPNQRGQASLRNALIRLRRTLGEAENQLLIDGDLLSFDLTAEVTLDLQAMALALESSNVAVLQKTIERYRGDFLEGFSLPDAPAFEEWSSLQREYRHRQMSEILARLSQLQTDQGQAPQGLDTARRWVAHDPLNEAAHRRLMELYASTGNKTAALQAYQICQATLAAELAIEPSPETKALAEYIRNFELSPDNSKSKLSNPKSMALPFVGRSIKHLRLVTAFHAARQEQPQVVIIEGEAGIGKTRLATEFLAWATTQGAGVLQGRAFEAGGRLPYQPLIEALSRRMEQENAPEDLLSDIWLAELSRLLPELRDRYPDLPLPAESDQEARTHLLEAAARLGQALAGRQKPVIIFIDDIQWADVASLDMVHYCSRSWAEAGSPILLLLAIRSETLAADASLQAWLANLERDIVSHHLALASLTVEDTRQLAHALVGREEAAALAITQRFGDWLFTETEGQPFFISETIKELVNRGILYSHLNQRGLWEVELAALDTWLAAGSSITPRGVRQLITTRLNRLTPVAAGLLTAGAILGRHCSYARLAQVAGLDEGIGLSGLDELLNAYLLTETNNASRPYTIAHDKIREVVYDQAGAARRRLFHQRAFEGLETATGQPEPGRRAAELAYHALGAHLAEPAFRYSQTAGDNALTLFAVHDAITYYEQAHTLITPHPLPVASDLLLNLGRAYELAGNLRQAETIYQELWQLVQLSNQPGLICTALNRLATVAVYGYDFDTAVDYLQQAIRLAEENNHQPGLAEAEWTLAQLYHHQFDFGQSLIHSERTLALAHDLRDEGLIAASLNSLGYAQMLLGQVNLGEATMVEARDRYVQLGNKALEADCLTAIAAAQIWQGRFHAGIKSARAAEMICAEIGNPWGYIYSCVWLATGLLDNGEYEAALAVALTGQRQAKTHQVPPMQLFIALVLGRVYRALGQLDRAYQVHKEALVLNEEIKSVAYAGLIPAELSTDCALVNSWPEAASYACEALAHRKYDVLPLVMPARWPETEALLRGGEIELAWEDAHRWGEVIGRIPRFQVGHLCSLAALAEWEGNRAQAIAHLEEALALAEGIGLPGEQGQILARLGALYQAGGDEGKARKSREAMAARVYSLAEAIGDAELKQGYLLANAW